MGPDDVVPLAEVRAGARRHRLLTDVAVRRPLDEPGAEELRRLLVEASDPDHRGVETFERVAAERHRAPPGTWAAGGASGEPPNRLRELRPRLGGRRPAPARASRPDTAGPPCSLSPRVRRRRGANRSR